MLQAILNEKRSRIRDLPELPPLPVVAEQILQQVTGEYVDIPRLAKTIEQDPGLLARIIGIANSAYFGCPDRIYTVNQAIVRVLGLSMVKSLALSIVLSNPFRVSQCPGFQLERYWYQAMSTALLAQRLAKYARTEGPEFSDHAYLAGLLHNLGELVMVHLFPYEMADVYRHPGEKTPAGVLQTQDQIVGINYLETGFILARKWHLPKDIRVMFEQRLHLEYRGEHWKTCVLSGLCCELAKLDSMPGELLPEHGLALDALGISMDQLAKVYEHLLQEREEINSMARLLATD
jgi:HD-like signal output (HDOD) protein